MSGGRGGGWTGKRESAETYGSYRHVLLLLLLLLLLVPLLLNFYICIYFFKYKKKIPTPTLKQTEVIGCVVSSTSNPSPRVFLVFRDVRNCFSVYRLISSTSKCATERDHAVGSSREPNFILSCACPALQGLQIQASAAGASSATVTVNYDNNSLS